MKCVLLGATQGCGLETLLNLIKKGHQCYVMCRTKSAFNETLRKKKVPSAETSRIIAIQGDAFNKPDVENLFEKAGMNVEFILFSLGGRLRLTFAPPKLIPQKICTQTIKIFLSVFIERFPFVDTQPRLIIISSNGLGAQGHKDLPWVLKPIYSWLLKEPHADKEEMERYIHKVGIKNDIKKTTGSLGNVVIVRPALLTNGKERGLDSVRCRERFPDAWTISRKDVGLFIVTDCVDDTWKGVGVTIAYK